MSDSRAVSNLVLLTEVMNFLQPVDHLEHSILTSSLFNNILTLRDRHPQVVEYDFLV